MGSLSQVIPANVINRVLNIRVGQKIGTAFTVEVDQRQYLITARHIIGENAVRHVMVRHGEWKNVDVITVGIGDGPRDVVVLAANQQLTTDYAIELGSEGIILGQNVRFLGYPLGIQMSYAQGNVGKEIPLIKAGILSGLRKIEEGKKGTWLLVDGDNNRGFSGGPIIYKDLRKEDDREEPWKFAGVVSGCFYEEIDVLGPDGETTGTARGNAGILAGAEIELALDMITANPVGYKLH